MQIRHGDVLLELVKEIPEGKKRGKYENGCRCIAVIC